jgi:hypothetical protein
MGRWGQRVSGEFNGPTGPNTKKPWREPIAWQDQRDSSVTVPKDTIGPNAARAFCGVVAAGSKLLFGAGPWVLLGLVVAAGGSLATTARRTRFRPVETTPLRQRRGFGQILLAAFRFARTHIGLFLGIGAAFVPFAALLTPAQWLLFENPPLEPVLDLMDSASARGIAALAVGGVGFGVAYWLVVAGVIAALGEAEAGRAISIGGAYRLVWQNIGTLARARLRALGIVFLLGVTVVGSPWAVRQAVRWVFLEHAVLLGGASAEDARAASERLVAGQWWHTLGVTLAVGFGAVATGPVVGMTILLFTSASLTFINLISSIIYVALIPYAATCLTMLYYDLQLAREEPDARVDVRAG